VRPIRVCAACGQVDDHPKHVINVPDGTAEAVPSDEFLETLPAGVPGTALRELLKPTVVVRHQDCCAAAGCIQCQAVEAASGGLRGNDLTALHETGALRGLEVPEVTDNSQFGIDDGRGVKTDG
jgi:hypothetical protein